MAYTTVDLISDELNGLVISSTTTPDTTTVNTWIAQADSEIDSKTGRVWSSSLTSSTILDSNGSKYFKFPEAPVISISSLEYEDQGLGASSENWNSLTEGRTNDFILYVTDGEVEFTGKTTIPPKGNKNLRITYTYGYSTTPVYITRLSTMLVAKRVVNATISDGANSGGGNVSVGNISITDPSNFGITQINNIEREIKELYASVGDVYTFRADRTYDMRY